MPSTSSWWSRISRPRTYRMWVIGRSASAFSGRSVSSRRTGHAADLGDPHRDDQVAAGELDGDRQRQAGRVLDAAERQAGEVVVGVVVLLVAVGVDRLAEVALAVEQPDADRTAGPCRWRTSCGRRRGRRGRRSRCRATRGSRTRRRSRRSGRPGVAVACAGTSGRRRWPCSASNSARTSWYSARNSASSRRRDQSVGPLMTGIGIAVAGPGRPVDPARTGSGSADARPMEVVGEAAQAFEPGRERESWPPGATGRETGSMRRASYPVRQASSEPV